MTQWEYYEQCAVIEWSERQKCTIPELELLTASLAGVRLPIGLAMKAKRSGMKKDMPDLHLPVARGGYHALFIEMKEPKKGRVRPGQQAMHERLNYEGNLCVVAYGQEEAIRIIKNYLAQA